MGVKLFCNKCSTEKPIKEFYKKKDSKTGRSSYCKVCIRGQMRKYHHENREQRISYKKEWYEKNKEEAREKIYAWKKENPEYMRQWHEQNKDKHAANIKRWHEKHPHYLKCHKEFRSALKQGKLFRPDRCSLCNREGKIEGHHHDYSKPLDVVWVCKECHNDIHAKHRLIGVK